MIAQEEEGKMSSVSLMKINIFILCNASLCFLQKPHTKNASVLVRDIAQYSIVSDNSFSKQKALTT